MEDDMNQFVGRPRRLNRRNGSIEKISQIEYKSRHRVPNTHPLNYSPQQLGNNEMAPMSISEFFDPEDYLPPEPPEDPGNHASFKRRGVRPMDIEDMIGPRCKKINVSKKPNKNRSKEYLEGIQQLPKRKERGEGGGGGVKVFEGSESGTASPSRFEKRAESRQSGQRGEGERKRMRRGLKTKVTVEHVERLPPMVRTSVSTGLGGGSYLVEESYRPGQNKVFRTDSYLDSEGAQGHGSVLDKFVRGEERKRNMRRSHTSSVYPLNSAKVGFVIQGGSTPNSKKSRSASKSRSHSRSRSRSHEDRPFKQKKRRKKRRKKLRKKTLLGGFSVNIETTSTDEKEKGGKLGFMEVIEVPEEISEDCVGATAKRIVIRGERLFKNQEGGVKGKGGGMEAKPPVMALASQNGSFSKPKLGDEVDSTKEDIRRSEATTDSEMRARHIKSLEMKIAQLEATIKKDENDKSKAKSRSSQPITLQETLPPPNTGTNPTTQTNLATFSMADRDLDFLTQNNTEYLEQLTRATLGAKLSIPESQQPPRPIQRGSAMASFQQGGFATQLDSEDTTLKNGPKMISEMDYELVKRNNLKLSEELAHLSSTNKALHNRINELEQGQETNASMLETLKALKKHYEALKSKLRKKQDEVSELRQKVEFFGDENLSLKNETSGLKEELRRVAAELQQAHQKLKNQEFLKNSKNLINDITKSIESTHPNYPKNGSPEDIQSLKRAIQVLLGLIMESCKICSGLFNSFVLVDKEFAAKRLQDYLHDMKINSFRLIEGLNQTNLNVIQKDFRVMMEGLQTVREHHEDGKNCVELPRSAMNSKKAGLELDPILKLSTLESKENQFETGYRLLGGRVDTLLYTGSHQQTHGTNFSGDQKTAQNAKIHATEYNLRTKTPNKGLYGQAGPHGNLQINQKLLLKNEGSGQKEGPFLGVGVRGGSNVGSLAQDYPQNLEKMKLIEKLVNGTQIPQNRVKQSNMANLSVTSPANNASGGHRGQSRHPRELSTPHKPRIGLEDQSPKNGQIGYEYIIRRNSVDKITYKGVSKAKTPVSRGRGGSTSNSYILSNGKPGDPKNGTIKYRVRPGNPGDNTSSPYHPQNRRKSKTGHTGFQAKKMAEMMIQDAEKVQRSQQGYLNTSPQQGSPYDQLNKWKAILSSASAKKAPQRRQGGQRYQNQHERSQEGPLGEEDEPGRRNSKGEQLGAHSRILGTYPSPSPVKVNIRGGSRALRRLEKEGGAGYGQEGPENGYLLSVGRSSPSLISTLPAGFGGGYDALGGSSQVLQRRRGVKNDQNARKSKVGEKSNFGKNQLIGNSKSQIMQSSGNNTLTASFHANNLRNKENLSNVNNIRFLAENRRLSKERSGISYAIPASRSPSQSPAPSYSSKSKNIKNHYIDKNRFFGAPESSYHSRDASSSNSGRYYSPGSGVKITRSVQNPYSENFANLIKKSKNGVLMGSKEKAYRKPKHSIARSPVRVVQGRPAFSWDGGLGDRVGSPMTRSQENLWNQAMGGR